MGGVEAEEGKGRRERHEENGMAYLETHGLYNLGVVLCADGTYMKYRKLAQLVMRAKKAELPSLGLVEEEEAVISLCVESKSTGCWVAVTQTYT